MTDPLTQSWIRNPADEQAAVNGCFFDVATGSWTVYWIESICLLYEGDGYAGQPLLLRGCQECGDYGLPPARELPWEEAEEVLLERARRHAECVAAGHAIDWQYDCTMRLFGWRRRSEKWRRKVRRFRSASIWVAKKNKKSPTLAAWGLYLLCGDGEPGQKVFLAAKDGQQARKIAGEHTVAMLEQSPLLSAECGVNRSTYRVTHWASRSWLEPLSSSNARTQQSKEGLNGSVLIDETHVVDREFVSRISRAGISRSEPLQIEVSTAGNNPDGYGRERFDYAREVEAGHFPDQELFVAIHAAPQDLADEQLEEDPEKYGRMANPAWGHTVDPEEFRGDYDRSKRSLASLIEFRMYRLNIWAKGSNPWLRESDWARCRLDFAEADLLGRDCWAGLDLGRTRDLSALVLVFKGDEPASPEEQEYLLLPYFWLPEGRARELDPHVPMTHWGQAGFIRLTPGDVTDFGWVRADVRELSKRFNIRELAYDPKFAEETTQALCEGTYDNQGNQLEEGTWMERIAFDQNDVNYAGPTQDYERLVIAGRLRHNGHPVLTWQAHHVHCMLKISKVKRAVKENKDSYKTIDGVVAGIMGLARARQAQPIPTEVEFW